MIARPRIALATLVGSVLAAPAAATAAQEPAREQRAAAAYDAAARAYEAGDYQRAAEAFLRANRLAPSPIALAQAVRAYRQGRQVRLAGTLGLRLIAQDGLPPALREIGEAAVADARPWYVRVDVDCGAPCTISVDGVDEETSRIFVPPDRPVVVVARYRDGATEERTISAPAGEALLVVFGGLHRAAATGDVDSLAARAVAETPLGSGENPYRIARYSIFSRPRATFFAVLAPTVVGAGMLTWSSLDTRRSRGRVRAAQTAGDPDALALAELEHHRNVRRTKWIAVEEGTFVFAAILVAGLTDWSPHGDDGNDARATLPRLGLSRDAFSATIESHF